MKNNLESHVDIKLKGNVKYKEKELEIKLSTELNGCEWAIIIALLHEVGTLVKTKKDLLEIINNIQLYGKEEK